LLSSSGDQFLVLQLFVVELKDLRLLCVDFLPEAGDLAAEDVPLVIELEISLFKLSPLVLQQHAHASDLLLE
jgi:hypothetical protein